MLVEDFIKYVKISSQSDASKSNTPTSEGQLQLAKLLKSELENLGLSEIKLNDNGILTALLAGDKTKTSLGFVAHLDTIDVGLSPCVNPKILRFEGKDLDLGKAVLEISKHPEIMKYLNEDIIFSDGSSVLGADNKAAIAVIMNLIKTLKNSDINHPDIFLAFVPDEEIGLLGSKQLNLDDFRTTHPYTIDCCEVGELMYETFNAASAKLNIIGVSAHPMNAYKIMLNPTLLANEFINLFDRLQTPENTKDKDGYIWINEMHSNQNEASVCLNIRDHDKTKFEEKKEYIKTCVDFMQNKYKKASFKLEMSDTYYNLKDALNDDNKDSLDKLYKAFELSNIKANTIAMRGGTDGSALSVKGLFTPNFFTGAHNFHSRFEFLPVKSLEKSYEVALNLVKIYSN
ncbi:peptidase T [Campylobacter sp. 2018MI01]|uniref:peptidase T n=1 Tax=unclassified Campylobacter TaxID=2593542 RepID=UPI001BDB32FE|nr:MULTISPECIES: peptidase T [unclassified Campylobacter]MBT0878078.1 peptidase T [Campylobacter sp. 2018MI01]MBT0881914.1 peptidase T [Campylobacter sp. 2018MI13]